MKILVLILIITFSLAYKSFGDDLIKNWNEIYKSENEYCKKLVSLKRSGQYSENTSNKETLLLVSNCVVDIADK